MENQLSFDLNQLRMNPQAPPAHSWLLLGPEATVPKITPFLLSVSKQHPQAALLLKSGHASSLEQANAFIHAALQGSVAFAILPRVIGHLNNTQHLDPVSGLDAEQQAFGAQFESETPLQGLQGFLQKRDTRFSLDSKSRQELQQVLAWLEAQL